MFRWISTHTPLAGRDGTILYESGTTVNFYSHAPRGARPKQITGTVKSKKFLLTRPSRGATPGPAIVNSFSEISTHTPLAGRDTNSGIIGYCKGNFYSHAPRGARHGEPVYKERALQFLLTRPSRGAT